MDYKGLYSDLLMIHGNVLFVICEWPNSAATALTSLQAFEYECRQFLSHVLEQRGR